jgi:aminoglycoside phosphotransferase (APT) family kinase protein
MTSGPAARGLGHPTGEVDAEVGEAGGDASEDDATEDAVDGVAVAPVSAWIADAVPDVVPPLRFSLIAGGRSNLTYRVTDATGRRLALRRPPLGHVLATAHDVAREHRILAALGPTDVPVPAVLGLCEDPAVNGAPFLVMEYVDGLVLRDATAVAQLPEPARRVASQSLAETLAALHLVDVDAVGLGDFARRDGYVERQLRRWIGQFRGSTVPGAELPAVVEEVHDALAAAVPPQRSTAIVHGDYRLDNAMVAPDGRVRAVLDWEICTLGDPLADLGLLMVYWTEPGDEAALAGVTPTAMPGFATRAELIDWYRAATGRSVDDLPYFVAFGYWKLACILQGVVARYVAGAAAGDRSSIDAFDDSVVALATRARDVLAAR